MRRYSLTYFIGQSFQGLWRNGVMSAASIMVLMSCLVVMGSFALLVYNINFNLDKLGVLNVIVAYVNTNPQKGADGTALETTEEDDALSLVQSLSGDTETAAAILEIEADTNNLENFIDFADTNELMTSISERIAMLKPTVEAIEESDRRARELIYLNGVISRFDKVSKRINSLMSIDSRLRALDNVASVTFTSKAAGLDEMRERFADYPTVFDNIRNNTLPDRFNITYTDNAKVATLQYNMEHLDPMVYKVLCHSDVAATMENIKQGVVLIFTWFLAILFIVSLFVIINTVKLAVYARRQEISIMRYVGATNWFIMLPFVFEGVTIGVLSGGIAYVVEYYIYNYIQNMVINDFATELITVIMFPEVRTPLIIGFAVVGILTGIIGSSVSLNRYMKA